MNYEEIQQKERQLQAELERLEAQKKRLHEEEKANALAKVESALTELNNLGYNYKLVEQKYNARKVSSKRSRGKTAKVLEVIQKTDAGISRQDLMDELNAHDDKEKASISASLNSLTKKGQITSPSRGFYQAVEGS